MGWEVSEVGNVSLSFSFVANNWALQELAVELLSWLGTQCWLGFPAASQQWILAGALRSDTPEEEERGGLRSSRVQWGYLHGEKNPNISVNSL